MKLDKEVLRDNFIAHGIDDEQFLNWFLDKKADELGLYWFSTGATMYEAWIAAMETKK